MMTASASPSECSLCQSRRADWPRTLRRAWTASWSQLEAGNWRTTKFIFTNGLRGASRDQIPPGSFDFKAVIFDDGVAQKFVAGLVDLTPGRLAVGAGQFDFQVFADMHRADPGITHLGQGVLHRFALGIEHRFFWCDDDLRFHFERTAPPC